MANIKRANTSGITKTGVAISDVPDAPTIGAVTDSGDGTTATVAYTAATTGGTATTFTATSSPGGLTGTGSSPISVTGLTAGTAYTFTVVASNTTGSSPASSASSSLTLVTPSIYESIQTVTSTGSETSLSFTSIPGTYKHLQIRGLGRYSGNAFGFTIGLRVRFNNDTAANYAWKKITGQGAAVAAIGYVDTDYGYVASSAAGGGVTSNIFGVSVIDIEDYASTSKFKTFRYYAGTDANVASTSYELSIGSSLWRSTSAITRIDIQFTDAGGASATGSTFALYGIKG